jgi:hypothetical protein
MMTQTLLLPWEWYNHEDNVFLIPYSLLHFIQTESSLVVIILDLCVCVCEYMCVCV